MNIYHQLDSDCKDIIDSHVYKIHCEMIKEELLKDLRRFFYYNQYDEVKFPHFMECDKELYEDEFGGIDSDYIFYENPQIVQDYSKKVPLIKFESDDDY
jgi:hypothetical protein